MVLLGLVIAAMLAACVRGGRKKKKARMGTPSYMSPKYEKV